MAELIVTGGTVMYEDAVKKPVPDTDPQYYPSKRASATIHFDATEDAPDDGEAVLDQAIFLATRKVAEMLGGAHRSPAVHPPQAPAAETTKRTRRTRAQIEADEAAKAAGGPTPAPASDPFDGEQPPTSNDGDAPTSDDGEWGAEPPAAAEVTDADLTAAVTKKNGEIKDAPRIRQLIGAFVDPPKGLKDIPQDQRADFLAKLGTLTKS